METLACDYVAGLAYDYMHTYDVAFYAAGAPPIIGALVLFLMPRKAQVTPLAHRSQAMLACIAVIKKVHVEFMR